METRKNNADEPPKHLDMNFVLPNGDEVGRLWEEGGTLHFEGEADESAKLFFMGLIDHYDKMVIELKDAIRELMQADDKAAIALQAQELEKLRLERTRLIMRVNELEAGLKRQDMDTYVRGLRDAKSRTD